MFVVLCLWLAFALRREPLRGALQSAGTTIGMRRALWSQTSNVCTDGQPVAVFHRSHGTELVPDIHSKPSLVLFYHFVNSPSAAFL